MPSPYALVRSVRRSDSDHVLVKDPGDELPEISPDHLNDAQRRGEACVACGRVFDQEDTPTSVGWFGTEGEQQVVGACFVCPPDPT